MRQRQNGLKPQLAHAALHSEDLPDYFTGTDLSNLVSDNDSHKAAKDVLDNLLSLGLLGDSFSSPREGVGGGRKIRNPAHRGRHVSVGGWRSRQQRMWVVAGRRRQRQRMRACNCTCPPTHTVALSNLVSTNNSRKAASQLLDELVEGGQLGGKFEAPSQSGRGWMTTWYYRKGVDDEAAKWVRVLERG
jgi:hypothetical protein